MQQTLPLTCDSAVCRRWTETSVLERLADFLRTEPAVQMTPGAVGLLGLDEDQRAVGEHGRAAVGTDPLLLLTNIAVCRCRPRCSDRGRVTRRTISPAFDVVCLLTEALANVSTGANPAHDTRFGSSNTAPDGEQEPSAANPILNALHDISPSRPADGWAERSTAGRAMQRAVPRDWRLAQGKRLPLMIIFC